MITLFILLGTLFPTATTLTYEEFTTQFEEKRKDIQVVEARYRQSDMYPGEVMQTTKNLLYIRPRRLVLWDEESTQLIDNKRFYEYEPLVRQLEITDFDENPLADIIFAAFDESVDHLADTYDLAIFTVLEYDEGSHGLRIRPLPDTSAAEYFQEATIYLRDEDFLPYRILIEHDADTQRLFEIYDYRVNHEYDPEDTRIVVAPGTRIILNNQPIDTVGDVEQRIPDPIYPSGSSQQSILEIQELAPPEESP